MHKSSHHKTNLNDLASEIILEIASYLDLKDIVSLQQTSKRLDKSINVPAVWLTLAKTYSARHFNIYRPQSGRFDDLTEQQLRRWIQKRLHFDRIWQAQTLQPQFRTLPEPSSGSPLKLVPGGRWLLAGSDGGIVWYCDLDSKEVEWRVLIEPSKDIEGSDQIISRLETYTDLDASELVFHLAIRTEGNSAAVEWLHMWQVKIKDGDALTAKWLTSVPTSRAIGWCYSLAIGRDVVARIMSQVRGKTAIEIFWWKQRSTTGFRQSHLFAPYGTDIMYLIGDDRILCAGTRGGVSLFDIPEPEYAGIKQNLGSHHPEGLSNPEPIWSYDLPRSGDVYYSPLYHDGATYRFTASASNGIWGFTIPAKKGQPSSIVQLSTFFDRRTICIPGLYKTFALYNDIDEGGIRIGYDWDDRSVATTYIRGELRGNPLSDPMRLAFDEESGRFLYYQGNEVVVLDFLDTDY